MFVDRLDGPIQTMVSRYREQDQKATYLDVVQLAHAERESVRDRSKSRMELNINANLVAVSNCKDLSRDQRPSSMTEDSINNSGDTCHASLDGVAALYVGEG